MLDTLSRVLLAAACLTSIATSVGMVRSRRIAGLYTPHLLFIAFWSFWFGWGMMSFAYDWWPDVGLFSNRSLVGALNMSAFATVIGWASFGFSLWMSARKQSES